MYVSAFNWETLEFEPETLERVYYFPRSESCEVSCVGLPWAAADYSNQYPIAWPVAVHLSFRRMSCPYSACTSASVPGLFYL